MVTWYFVRCKPPVPSRVRDMSNRTGQVGHGNDA